MLSCSLSFHFSLLFLRQISRSGFFPLAALKRPDLTATAARAPALARRGRLRITRTGGFVARHSFRVWRGPAATSSTPPSRAESGLSGERRPDEAFPPSFVYPHPSRLSLTPRAPSPSPLLTSCQPTYIGKLSIQLHWTTDEHACNMHVR